MACILEDLQLDAVGLISMSYRLEVEIVESLQGLLIAGCLVDVKVALHGRGVGRLDCLRISASLSNVASMVILDLEDQLTNLLLESPVVALFLTCNALSSLLEQRGVLAISNPAKAWISQRLVGHLKVGNNVQAIFLVGDGNFQQLLHHDVVGFSSTPNKGSQHVHLGVEVAGDIKRVIPAHTPIAGCESISDFLDLVLLINSPVFGDDVPGNRRSNPGHGLAELLSNDSRVDPAQAKLLRQEGVACLKCSHRPCWAFPGQCTGTDELPRVLRVRDQSGLRVDPHVQGGGPVASCGLCPASGPCIGSVARQDGAGAPLVFALDGVHLEQGVVGHTLVSGCFDQTTLGQADRFELLWGDAKGSPLSNTRGKLLPSDPLDVPLVGGLYDATGSLGDLSQAFEVLSPYTLVVSVKVVFDACGC